MCGKEAKQPCGKRATLIGHLTWKIYFDTELIKAMLVWL